jgi:hypothetical protein
LWHQATAAVAALHRLKWQAISPKVLEATYCKETAKEVRLLPTGPAMPLAALAVAALAPAPVSVLQPCRSRVMLSAAFALDTSACCVLLCAAACV